MITTEEHPFWVPRIGWVEAKDLKVGDRLVDNEGKEYPIESIEIEKEKRTVYNFKVNGYHNYFVTDLSIWTHNCGSGARSLGGLGTVARSYPPTGGGGTYNRPANVSRGPVGVKIEISLPKNVDQFYRSSLKKGLESNKGTGNIASYKGQSFHYSQESVKKGGKSIADQITERGWNDKRIGEAINKPAGTVNWTDQRKGKNNAPVTAYYHKDGGYVVRSNATGEIIQVSQVGDPNWSTYWSPDAIKWIK